MADLRDTLVKVDRAINNTIYNATHRVGNDSLYTDGGIIDFNSLWNTPIEKYCMIEMADRQKLRLMSMSLLERNVTIAKLGDSTSGVSNHVSDEVHRFDYSYTAPNNYLHEYQMMADKTTTQKTLESNNYQNYHKEGHNSLYGITMNAYYDDNDSGTDKFGPSRKIEYYDANLNRNSILNKTKRLFVDRKINTIISRFHTDNEKMQHNDTTESARSVYGLSHGRNLLTYDAERNGNAYDTNGYNNPYCRVWTHHHQYSEERTRLMRPFYTKDEYGNASVRKDEDLHNWDNFDDVTYQVENSEYDPNKIVGVEPSTTPDLWVGSTPIKFVRGGYNNTTTEVKWGWKSKGADGWKYSVLNKDTGLVNIAPKYLGGAEKNVHTKDCMFSIENLAWQGYDPYSFERALSWEQRGPFGGRIMWFPPYGLSFSEDSSVNWNEHSFIGRGENVYTYTNTSRSGTLSFMMVVDHPSILDYATWHNPSDLKDTDVMRFFAGCDGTSGGGPNGGNSKGGGNGILQSFAKPTPLTDEYLQSDSGPGPVPVTENVKPEPASPTEESAPTPDENIEIKFYVFFPNNYSGHYDREQNSVVDPIAYLLFGKGAQWNCNINNVTQSKDLNLDFDDLTNKGTGYEMLKKSDMDGRLVNDNNYVAGTNYNTKGRTYVVNNEKKWFYRIDGEYKAPILVTETQNCFAQFLVKYVNGKATGKVDPERMKNTSNHGLNYDVDSVLSLFGIDKTDENKEKYYSLSEIAYVLCKIGDKNDAANNIKGNSKVSDNDERIKRLTELLDYKNKDNIYEITDIKCDGYSNSHGYNNSEDVNKKRNEFLANERAETVINWFKQFYKKEITGTPGTINPGVNDKVEEHNENGLNAKKYRCAITTLVLKKSDTKTAQDSNTSSTNEDNSGTIQLTEDGYNTLIDGQEDFKLYYKCVNDDFGIIGINNLLTEDEYNQALNSEYHYRPEDFEKVYVNVAKNTISAADINEMGETKWNQIKDKYEVKYIRNNNSLDSFCMFSTISDEITSDEYDNLPEERKKCYIIGSYRKKEDNKSEIDKGAESGDVKFDGWKEVGADVETQTTLYQPTTDNNTVDEEGKTKYWYYDEKTQQMKIWKPDRKPSKLRNSSGWTSDYDVEKVGNDYNSLRYDQEYHFFKQLEATHPDIFSSVVEKLQYFDPAFHSMTPEGFMGRLNFLHQCTRQGDTIANSDKNGFMANNLAFGRPPFCVLRLGDFYYQKIVIQNINITYDPLVLDLNNEGVGVVPLIANVTISFKFIGGGDLTGAVRRLQNAMSFNYYANGRLYDNRADRIERTGTGTKGNWDSMNMGDIDFANQDTYFHHVPLAKNK